MKRKFRKSLCYVGAIAPREARGKHAGECGAQGKRRGRGRGKEGVGKALDAPEVSRDGIYWSSRKIAQVFLPHCDGFPFASVGYTLYSLPYRDTFVLEATAPAATRCSRVIHGIRGRKGEGQKGFSRFRVFIFLNSCVNNGIRAVYFPGYRTFGVPPNFPSQISLVGTLRYACVGYPMYWVRLEKFIDYGKTISYLYNISSLPSILLPFKRVT